jgi:TIR domain
MPWRGAAGLPWRLLGFTPPYDVFISYRRKHASELAQLIRRELEDRRLHVFLDVRELGAGRFDEQLLRRIARATDFVVVLTPGCLDECQRPGDWLAKEIGHAFDTGRNVVPVAVGGFECPPAQQLPPELVELPRQQWVRYEHEFSDESIERVYRMLRSRRRRSLGFGGRARGTGWDGMLRRLRWVALAVGVLFLVAIGAAVLQQSARTPATRFTGTAAVSPFPNARLWCCDAGGFKRCPIVVNPGPPGSQCFCPGQGMGIACQ